MPEPQMIPFGRLGRPHGIRGAIRISLHRPDSPALPRMRDVELRSGDRSMRTRVVESHPSGRFLVARFEGILDPEQASEWTLADLLVPRDLFPALDDSDEFYAFELEGMAAVDGTGAELGRVVALADWGGGDILVVRCGGEEKLVPFAAPWVGRIDRAARTVEIDLAALEGE